MELFGTLLRGGVIGLAIAAPVGPIGLLCIRRTISDGRLAGLVSGLGAATADALYGGVAAFGLTSISEVLAERAFLLRIIGGVFLIYLGVRTFLKPPPEHGEEIPPPGNLALMYASTFLLTMTNPTTILSFAAVFAGLGLNGTAGLAGASTLVMGVFLGSALWWLFLSAGIGFVGGRISSGGAWWIQNVSGCVLFGFGAYAISGAVGL